MPTGVPPVSVPSGALSTSGSPSALGSTSRHSSARVDRSALSIPCISCSSSSSTRGLCLVLRPDANSLLSVTNASCAWFCRNGSCRSLPVQGVGPVHRRPAARIAPHLVLRLLRAGTDGPPGGRHGCSSARSRGRPCPCPSAQPGTHHPKGTRSHP